MLKKSADSKNQCPQAVFLASIQPPNFKMASPKIGIFQIQ